MYIVYTYIYVNLTMGFLIFIAFHRSVRQLYR